MKNCVDSEGRDVAFEILGNKGEKTSKDDTVTLLYGTLTYQFQDSNEDLTGSHHFTLTQLFIYSVNYLIN